jgi:hypothetical protein
MMNSTGLVSVVAKAGRDREIEVGIIGREGMTGMNVVMGNDRSPHHTYMQVEGRGHRIVSDSLRPVLRQSETPSLNLQLRCSPEDSAGMASELNRETMGVGSRPKPVLQLLPPLGSCSFANTSSSEKLPGFCRGGNST